MRVNGFTDKNYYHYLGIDRINTNPEDIPDLISSSYKRLMKKYHPDANPGDKKAEDFARKLNEAYDVLSDPDKRRLYDAWLAQRGDADGNRTFRSQGSRSGSDSYTAGKDFRSSDGNAQSNSDTSGAQNGRAHYKVDFDKLRKEAFAGYEKWQAQKRAAQAEYARRMQASKRARTLALTLILLIVGISVGYGKREQLSAWFRKKIPALNTVAEAAAGKFGGRAHTDTDADTALSEASEAGMQEVSDRKMTDDEAVKTQAQEAKAPRERELDTYTVTGEGLNIRPTPSTEGERIGKLSYGTECTGTGQLSEDGGWIEIYVSGTDGQTGWVSANYLEPKGKVSVLEDGSPEADPAADAAQESGAIAEGADSAKPASSEANAAAYARFHDAIDRQLASFVPDPLNTVSLSVGGTHKPSAAVWDDITVYSTDESVVTVTDAGMVTAVGKGEAYVAVISNIAAEVAAAMGSEVMMEVYRYTVS